MSFEEVDSDRLLSRWVFSQSLSEMVAFEMKPELEEIACAIALLNLSREAVLASAVTSAVVFS